MAAGTPGSHVATMYLEFHRNPSLFLLMNPHTGVDEDLVTITSPCTFLCSRYMLPKFIMIVTVVLNIIAQRSFDLYI